MKLKCAIVSCNENKNYLDCWTLVKKMWNECVGIPCKMILIADTIPKKYLCYSDDIILFKPIHKMHSVFIAQCVRFLYPSLMTNIDGGIIMSDMDMVPINGNQFVDIIENYSDDVFISYRDVLLNENQIAICYNVATPKTFSDIFNIHSEKDIRNLLKRWYSEIKYDGKHGGKGWCTDQVKLYKFVMQWNQITNLYIALNDKKTHFKRISRGNPILQKILNDEESEEIKHIKYWDFHMLMPFDKYESDNLKIIDTISKH